MQYPKYQALTTKPDFTGFSFISMGPKGNFEIEVQFTFILQNEDSIFYNLGFGTIAKNGELNDAVVLNNGDRDKILATIVGFIVIFFEQYPTASIFFSGSTPARTRLYRRAITLNLKELQRDFEIIGIPSNSDEKPNLFVRGKEYLAFLVRKYQ